MSMKILITGSEGYLGQKLTLLLHDFAEVYGIDIIDKNISHYHYQRMDIRAPQLSEFIRQSQITHVIHLASIVQPSDDKHRDFDIDVNGTRNLLDACAENDVRHITVTSSGAAYGYHADNPEWLRETDKIRGNKSFPYSYHKRLVEEMLAEFAQSHPEISQLILRPGTILGKHTNNLITSLFRQNRLLAIRGSKSPFVFIWDEDVVEIIKRGTLSSKTGIYNLAGDGAMSIQEIARTLGKPNLTLPAGLVKTALLLGSLLKLTRYGPDQVDFLRYRPVLDNAALKNEFSFTPNMTSREVFEFFARHQGLI
ncbi:SDR family oxidoreductase [Neptunicella sp. SCSIO 80796]|uniref:SDR family oxidoreductase n=1 Tax=Neptunicella plasticusilytica TaxID=3117012 RepID=UPI003A4DFA8C